MEYVKGVKCRSCDNLGLYRYTSLYPCQKCGTDDWRDLVLKSKSAAEWYNPFTWFDVSLEKVTKHEGTTMDQFDLIDKAYEFNDHGKQILRLISEMHGKINHGSNEESINLTRVDGKKFKLTLRGICEGNN